MEPDRATAAELEMTLRELRAREPLFHRPELGTTRADIDRMIAEDFWETGASGRRYSRAFVLDELERRANEAHEDVWETSEFQCRQIAPGTFLLTYTLLQNRNRLTRRMTLWKKTQDGWKALYHQGTIVADV